MKETAGLNTNGTHDLAHSFAFWFVKRATTAQVDYETLMHKIGSFRTVSAAHSAHSVTHLPLH